MASLGSVGKIRKINDFCNLLNTVKMHNTPEEIIKYYHLLDDDSEARSTFIDRALRELRTIGLIQEVGRGKHREVSLTKEGNIAIELWSLKLNNV